MEPLNPIQFLPWDATKFVMQSQKDGYNHLYLFDKNGKELKQLTSGKWVVLDVVGFNTKTKSILILGNESYPINSHLYSVNVNNGERMVIADRWAKASVWFRVPSHQYQDRWWP